MNANALLVWMRRPLPAVAPGAPLCVHCGVRAAVTDDGELTACMACVLRLGSIAAQPIAHTIPVLANLTRAHAEVAYLVSCRAHVLDWAWTRAWPGKGDETLTAPETAWRAINAVWRVADAHEARS